MIQTRQITRIIRQIVELAFIITAIASIAVWLATGQSAQGQDNTNKFSDTVLQHIHDLADQRAVDQLLPYLRDSNMQYRFETLLCLGSVQEKGIEDSIMQAMISNYDGIRIAGAFALGQSYDDSAAVCIRSLLEIEKKPLVRGMLYEALGKTGNLEDLIWLAEDALELQETEGQATGILRFALRGISSAEAHERMVAICAEGSSLAGLTAASYYLARYADIEWLKSNAVLVRQLFDNERNDLIRSQLIKAVIKAEQFEAWPLVENLLNNDIDYRIKVNILNSMAYLPWNKANKLVYKMAIGEHRALAAAAAERIQIHAVYTDLQTHLSAIDQAASWRSRAVLLAKGMDLVEGKKSLTKRMRKNVFDQYEKAGSPTEKAWILKAFGSDPTQYAFVEQEWLKSRYPVISTSAVETLVTMRSSRQYATAKGDLMKDGTDLDDEFLRLFKRAIASGDVPAVSLAAGALSDPKLQYKETLDDFEFLKTALNRAQAPELVEARNSLIVALAYFMDKQITRLPKPSYNHPIDWERVTKIHPKQQLAIVTDIGDIIVQLNVNWCPGTVGAFIQLVKSGFYNGKPLHRVVPNFVMQDGCPRGDGWGSPEFTLRSEFTPAPFVEGTLGMASAGKDTEGSQWYITHSPTPHLDGKYTNFGYVVSGMEVVHQLDVGDVIKRIEIIKQ